MTLTQDEARQLITGAMEGSGGGHEGFAAQIAAMTREGGPSKRVLTGPALQALGASQRRDLGAALFTAGGALVGTQTAALEQFFIGAELADLGVTVRTGLSAPVTIPRVSTLPTGSWLSVEGASISEQQPVLAQAAVGPNYLAAYTDVSRQLSLQGGRVVVEQVVGGGLGENYRRTLFRAMFTGTGTAGQPTGLLQVPGVQTQSGTSLSAVGLRSMMRKVLDAGAAERNIRWIADPATAELLGGRELNTGWGVPAWFDGKVLGRPAIATSLMPSGSIVCGDFARATVWLFDKEGAGLEADPYSSFATGVVRYRLILACDFSFGPANAFCTASGVT